MDRILILDTETAGLEPEKDRCIEVAVVTYSIAHRAVVDAHSWLLQADSNAAEPINHIPAGLLDPMHAYDPMYVWSQVEERADEAEAILAHNADFDRHWAPEFKHTISHEPIPWIDTCGAVDWPKQSKPGASLINLALEHGLAVVDPHRALSDCLLLARLLTRCAELGHDVSTILERGLRPTATFQALVTYDQRQAAKDAGFHWEAPRKQWLRKMAIEDAAKLPFRVANLDEGMLKGTL
jgi:DNA polymerase-3 subunit epsilon